MRIPIALLVIAALLPLGASAGIFGDDDVAEEREKSQEMRTEVLERLYDEEPDTKAMIANATGYAVFSNRGFNILLVSTANGRGIAHDNESGEDIYMSMFSAGGGLGVGIKKFSAVFVFHSRDAFDQFVEEGWNFSGQADAAATTDAEEGKGAGAADAAGTMNESVSIYQMTEKGLALQATLQGTKYWKNDDLN